MAPALSALMAKAPICMIKEPSPSMQYTFLSVPSDMPRAMEEVCPIPPTVRKSVYINSGVLVMDLNAWVERKAGQRIMEYVRCRKELAYPDQDAISYVMSGDIMIIPLEYNMMWMICDSDIPKLVRNIKHLPYTAEEIRNALHGMKICHYSGHDMWTFYGITPIQARIFEKYRRICDWRNERRSFETPVKFVLWVMKSVKRFFWGDLATEKK